MSAGGEGAALLLRLCGRRIARAAPLACAALRTRTLSLARTRWCQQRNSLLVQNGGVSATMPRKPAFRSVRTHRNPLSDYFTDDTPIRPDDMKLDEMFPARAQSGTEKQISIVDVGCGFGGLLVRLASLHPEKLVLGMEIRQPVVNYVQKRIAALRANDNEAQNCQVVFTNAMKYFPNFFSCGQLEKIFFCFPDPHFKRAKQRWRIISRTLLTEYAYCLKEGGLIYTITDVRALHNWMVERLEAHPLFERLSEQEMAEDPLATIMGETSEEAQRVDRNNGFLFPAVFRRIAAR